MSEAAKCTWKTPSFVLIPDSNPLEPHAQIEDLLLLQYPLNCQIPLLCCASIRRQPCFNQESFKGLNLACLSQSAYDQFTLAIVAYLIVVIGLEKASDNDGWGVRRRHC